MAKLSPLDIVRRTPMTNCRQCGQPSCLAFGAAVVKTGFDPNRCPYIDLTGLDLAAGVPPAKDQQTRDLEFIAQLKEKVAPLDFAGIAPLFGAAISQGGAIHFPYLGQKVSLFKDRLLIEEAVPEDPRDQILIYNYIASPGDHPPTSDWVGMESLPNSISKIKTLATYCEARLATLFTETPLPRIVTAVEAIGGTVAGGQGATLAVIIPVLPMVPQFVHFWEEAPEDNFAAQVKVLFDRHVLSFLDLESLVFSAERMTDRLTAIIKQQTTA